MPTRYRYVTVDVFTDRPFTGNPLAVVTDARGLTPAAMQAIAAEFNYSESTFVLPAGDAAHTARVRIFTRQTELPFAGHPNIGTAFVIAREAERTGAALAPTLLFEEGAGIVPVDVLRDDRRRVVGATLTAPQPVSIGRTIPAVVVASCVGLDPSAVRTSTHEPVLVSVGLPFVIAEVASGALAAARPDAVAFAEAARRFPLEGGRLSIHLYARTAGDNEAQLRARMFSPLGGTVEDPATGSANGALVGLLASLDPAPDTPLSFNVLQGAEMGRPSILAVSAEKQGGSVVRVRVGGRCAPVMAGELSL
jgi:trans-2,3-dihydro-3-hydroxyanthranilate isomerase